MRPSPRSDMKDITGERFGKLVAQSYSRSADGTIFWTCRCDCGGQRSVRRPSLVTGRTRSCGCLARERPQNKRDELTGERFGRLVVTTFSHAGRGGLSYWLCRCDCGNDHVVRGSTLRYGTVVSCGCYNKEVTAARSALRATHGRYRKNAPDDPTFSSWKSMHRRCAAKPGSHHHEYYVARGISVCERWSSFDAFLEDMGPRPLGKTLDRVNGALGYAPENCRWATPKEQANNRRRRVDARVAA